MESDFQGDVLAVISACFGLKLTVEIHIETQGMLSTALRTGTPLPQITPSPLLDRFIVHQNGFNVVQDEEESDYGLPKVLTIDTLENEQYL